MDNRYKIVISSRNIYREIELSPETKQLKIGTGKDCDVRLLKNMFFGQVELLFVKKDNVWSVQSSDNLYLTVGDIRKLMTLELKHGDIFEVKYFDSDNTVFHVEFIIDFDDGNVRYERIIDTSYQTEIRIGAGRSNNIVISSPYIRNDAITLKQNRAGYTLEILESTYGVYHNGKLAKSGELVKDGDFISISDFFFCIKGGRVWSQIRDDLSVNSIRYTDKPRKNGYPKFNRSTRVKTLLNREGIEILDPPAKAEKPKNNIVQRLLPSMGMLVASIFMASRGGSMVIFSLISGGLSIVTAIIGLMDGKKEYVQKLADRNDTYRDYIERKREEIEQNRDDELRALNEMYISQSDVVENFEDFSPRLFDRRKEDEDFLHVRLGNGMVKSVRKINYKKQEKLEIEDELQSLPGELCKEYEYIASAPIVCALKDANAVGIVGQEQFRFDFLKNIVLDVSARQFHSDVKMIFVAEPGQKERIHWFRTLPHVWCDTIGSRLIVSDDESKNLVFEYLYKELSARQQSKSYEEHILVFFYNEYGFKNHPISKFVDQAGKLGISFVFFADSLDEIPLGCSALIDVTDAQNATLIYTEDKETSVEFEYPRISEQEMQDIIDILTPVYTEELSLEGTLTKSISMFEMLNILAVDDLNLEERWAASNVSKSMAAPLGVSKSGIVDLDLHDKAHGPHGLVAGTTGSGKSEILQTYILAMSTLFHPYEVGFVIIDFKGGGMVNQFRELPHLVGAITNIDGKEINRSLKSIKAELQKRQRLFADADVNHIDKYIAKFKSGGVTEPLPHLIIIVDEFAELKAEQPEFMKELISAARIGRSLGVHLILATQKPSGQVNEQIWSNSRFKLCLKVQTQEDSNEVLKSPLAAEIREPGRAYLQVGNNEIFELFQSAYSGAPEKTDDSNVKEFTIYNIADSGKRIPVYTQKKKKENGGNTQLDAIVEYVARFCDSKGIESLPDICLPALDVCLPLPDSAKAESLEKLPIGIYDDPDSQYQGPAYFSLCDNSLIIGSTATGKTNLIQTLLRLAAVNFTPKDINFYIADFGSMYLKNYEALKHVGGVVTIGDTEKFKNLFKLLMQELHTRKEIFQKYGLSSFSAYKEAGHSDLPQIVFILENFSAFKEVYADDYEDQLIHLLREGKSCGLSVIFSNTSTAGLGYKYMSNVDNKIAFRCNDSGEYNSLFDRCRIQPDNFPGRAICLVNKEIYEAQTFLAFEGEKEYERSEKIRAFTEAVALRHPNESARKIPTVPDQLSFSYMESNFGRVSEAGKYPLGLDYATVEIEVLDMQRMNELCIVNSVAAKRQAIAEKLIRMVHYYALEKPVSLYIFDNVKRTMKGFAAHPFTELYTIDYSSIEDTLDSIKDEAERRYDMLMDEDSAAGKQNHIIVVVNNSDAIEFISKNRSLMASYTELVKKYSVVGISFWFTDIEDVNVSYNAPDLLKRLRDNKQVITEGSLSSLKFVDVSSSVARRFKAVNPGDVFVITESDVKRIKLAEED